MTTTLQSIFDTVATHLITQNRPALSRLGSPQYRTGSLTCSVGCLIPADSYDRYIEGYRAHTEIVLKVLPREITATPNAVLLLSSLQRVHDSARTALNEDGTWFRPVLDAQLMVVADSYNLNTKVLHS